MVVFWILQDGSCIQNWHYCILHFRPVTSVMSNGYIALYRLGETKEMSSPLEKGHREVLQLFPVHVHTKKTHQLESGWVCVYFRCLCISFISCVYIASEPSHCQWKFYQWKFQHWQGMFVCMCVCTYLCQHPFLTLAPCTHHFSYHVKDDSCWLFCVCLLALCAQTLCVHYWHSLVCSKYCI